MIITRELLNKDLKIYNPLKNSWDNYQSLCKKIDQIKNTLLKRGAQKGNTVALIQLMIDTNHIASVIACLELGLKLIVADMPATRQSLPYCKLAMRGPVDFTLYGTDIFTNRFESFDKRPWGDMIFKYSRVAINETEYIDDVSPTPIYATNDAVGLVSSSSGTTNWSKSIDFTHNEIYLIASRNVDLFGYKKTDVVAQTKNLHHGGSLLISFLPSLMTCDLHVSAFISDYKNYFDVFKDAMVHIIKTIDKMGCNRITITNYDIFESFLELAGNTIGSFKKTLIIIPFVFKSTQKLIDLAKKYNVEVHNTYGSIDSQMIPLAINRSTKDSVFIENYVGDWVDDGFYSIDSIGEHGVHTFRRIDGRLCTIQDTIEIKDGKVYLYARAIDENSAIRQQVEKYIKADFSVVQNGDDKYLALFEDTEIPEEIHKLNFKNILKVDKTLFYGEAKINYDALRGHFIFYDTNRIFKSIKSITRKDTSVPFLHEIEAPPEEYRKYIYNNYIRPCKLLDFNVKMSEDKLTVELINVWNSKDSFLEFVTENSGPIYEWSEKNIKYEEDNNLLDYISGEEL